MRRAAEARSGAAWARSSRSAEFHDPVVRCAVVRVRADARRAGAAAWKLLELVPDRPISNDDDEQAAFWEPFWREVDQQPDVRRMVEELAQFVLPDVLRDDERRLVWLGGEWQYANQENDDA